jgi:hypothetical protein
MNCAWSRAQKIHLTGKITKEDMRVRTTWKTPEKIVPQQIKYCLCKDGPNKCAGCRMCAFGRYYIDNHLGDLEEPPKNKENHALATA